MGVEHYIFAAFIFLLLCALLFLYRRFVVLPKGKKADAETEAQGKEKEERLFRLYQNIEEMMDNFEGYIEDTREQMDSMKGQMERQQSAIEELIRRAEATEARAQSTLDGMHAADRHQPKAELNQQVQEKYPVEPGRKGKQDAVRDLLNKGMTVEQIAQKLELSINEVKLVVYGMMSKPGERK